MIKSVNFCSFNVKNQSRPSFGQADVNIAATSDSHGILGDTYKFYNSLNSSMHWIYPKTKEGEKKSSSNIFAVVGDWFINPAQKGFKSDPEKPAGVFQALFLDKTIKLIKRKVPDLETLYVPGNHCLEGGDSFLFKLIKNLDMKTIMSNVDLKSSDAIKNLSEEQKEKIAICKIVETPDDKTDKIHKTLFLGMVCPNMNYYNRGLNEGLNIFDKSAGVEADIKQSELPETYKALNVIIQDFKSKNPDSPVVLMNHAGSKLAKFVVQNVDDIDLILGAHDHKDDIEILHQKSGKKTINLMLSENFKKFESVNIHFDDEGKFKIEHAPAYSTTAHNKNDTRNELLGLYEKSFKEDNLPLIDINDPLNRRNLSLSNVRYANNHVANLITDMIMSAVQKDHPQVELLGFNSSAFRQDLPTSLNRSATNMEMMKMLDGSIDDHSKVLVGELLGEKIRDAVLSNVVENRKNKHRNTIMQWSNLRVNKSSIDYFLQDESSEKNKDNLYRYIQLKNKDGEYEDLDPKRKYKVALPNKFFFKNKDASIRAMEKDFTQTNKTLNGYLQEFLCSATEDAGFDSNGQRKIPQIEVPTDKRII